MVSKLVLYLFFGFRFSYFLLTFSAIRELAIPVNTLISIQIFQNNGPRPNSTYAVQINYSAISYLIVSRQSLILHRRVRSCTLTCKYNSSDSSQTARRCRC